MNDSEKQLLTDGIQKVVEGLRQVWESVKAFCARVFGNFMRYFNEKIKPLVRKVIDARVQKVTYKEGLRNLLPKKRDHMSKINKMAFRNAKPHRTSYSRKL